MTATELLQQTQRQAGLNKTAFAAALGISQALLSYIYQGKRAVSAETLRKLGAAFPETTAQVTALFLSGNITNAIVQ